MIEELISSKKYFEAIQNIQKELHKSFDLTDEVQRNYYNKLNDLRAEVDRKIAEDICDEINKEDRLRSKLTQLNRSKVVINDHISIMEAFTQIAVEKYVDFSGAKNDAFICFLNSKNIPNEIKASKDFPTINKLQQLQNGDHFSSQIVDGRVCYAIIGGIVKENSDATMVVNGLKEIIDIVYEEKHESIGILFSFDNEQNDEEYQKAYFYLILISLLLKIMQNVKDPCQPNFFFLFHDDRTLELFQRAAVRFNRSEPKQIFNTQNKEEKLKNLASNCLTKNPVFVKELESVLHVINEDDVPILILGESGVGKSILAGIIHKASIRSGEPFEEVNCGSMAGDKLDQKMWGWKKGSFTGALYDGKGKIKRAEKGTLFLDEIDRAEISVRNGLLTFIETKQYEILGDKKPSEADVRLIFGTNKDLKLLVQKGQLEQDFYFRISERIIEIPPLKDRVEDIDLIVDWQLSNLNEKKNTYISIEKEAVKYLKNYSWPGNVRELMRYIKQRYYDCKAEEKSKITLEQIKAVPFDNFSPLHEDDFEEFIDTMKKLLDNWDETNGAFLDEVLSPILAKLYIDDCYKHLGKTTKKEGAMKIIGINGGDYNRSPLQKSYDKYPELKKKLGF